MHKQHSGKKSSVLEQQRTRHRSAIISGGLPGFCLLWAFTVSGQVTNYDFNVRVTNVYTLAVQQDGKILVAGYRYGLRLNTNGTLDPSFAPVNPSGQLSGIFYTLAVQEDGKLLAGGYFRIVNGQPHTNVVRFNSDGSLDSTFNIQTIGLGEVFCLAFEPGAKKLLGGDSFRLPGQISQGLCRLDGSDLADTTFDPGPSGTLFGLAVQGDGKILASGSFGSLGGAPSGSVGRLNSDGTPDPSFSASAINYANCMAGQADGKILIGTTATENGITISNLVRLNYDGSLDTNFDTHADPYFLSALAVQCDGKILVGGRFTTLGGQPRKGLGRVNPDGSVDASFVPLYYDAVIALGLDSDGKILIGGRMVDSTGKTNAYVGRLQNTGPATENLSWDGSAITWMRGGTAPEIWWASFQSSTNATNWTELGVGQRIPGGWRLVVTNQSQLPPGSTIRASGAVSVGQFNGTSWFVQSYLPITSPLAIINDVNLGFTSNGFGFNFAAPTNSTVIIEVSTDLLNWTPVATNTVTSGPAHFTDPAPPVPRRFYRLRLGS